MKILNHWPEYRIATKSILKGWPFQIHPLTCFTGAMCMKTSLLEIQLDALMNYLLSGNDAVPAIKIYTIHLPTYNEIPSGLSGACIIARSIGYFIHRFP